MLCYANALNGEFQFDDYNVIINNSRVHSWGDWLHGLSHSIRPLLNLSYTINWTSGTGVIGFHLTNILIHLANTFLVYLLAKEFIRPQIQADALRHSPLIAALLFAIHPIHTEAVTYICGRSSSLMALFYLAGLFTYISGRNQQSNLKIYFLTPLFFMLALSVKETAITFPLALLLWEYACGGKWQSALRPQWPGWLVLILSTFIFLFSHSYWSQIERSAQFNSLQGNAATQIYAFSYLLRQWALPTTLNIDPDLTLQHDFSASLLPLILLASIFVLMLSCWRRHPWISFSLAWAILQLIPLYLFLPRLDIANDRQMYLASWPLLLALVIELTLRLNRRALQISVASLMLILASLTILRNRDYATEISLWKDTVKKSPDKARVHNNLGYAYLLAHCDNQARREFAAALQLDPDNYKARFNNYRADDELGTGNTKRFCP